MIHVKGDIDHGIDDMKTGICAMIGVMSHSVDRILEVSQRLQELRQRAVALDAERAALQQQIEACVNELSSTVEEQRLPPMAGTMAEQIIAVLQRNKTRPLAPSDVADILDIRSYADVGNIRVLMSRMSRDGRIEKVTRARYRARGARTL
jgi:vacuolar-type H+-ATPase subunit I/STV1